MEGSVRPAMASELAPSGTPATCPECGGRAVDGLTCWAQLGAILAWEWQNPALQAEHFLTVASYNLQHPAQFTDETLAWLRAAYLDVLEGRTTPAAVRRQMAPRVDGQTRVLKRKAERQPFPRQWQMTIADVYGPAQPGGAAERVRAWAAAIR